MISIVSFPTFGLPFGADKKFEKFESSPLFIIHSKFISYFDIPLALKVVPEKNFHRTLMAIFFSLFESDKY